MIHEIEFEQVPFTVGHTLVDAMFNGTALIDVSEGWPTIEEFTVPTSDGSFWTIPRRGQTPDQAVMWRGLADNILRCCASQIEELMPTSADPHAEHRTHHVKELA